MPGVGPPSLLCVGTNCSIMFFIKSPLKKPVLATLVPSTSTPKPATPLATSTPSVRLVTLTPVSPPKFVQSPQRKPEPSVAVISVASAAAAAAPAETKRIEKSVTEIKMCRVCNAPVKNFREHLRIAHKLSEQVKFQSIEISEAC